MKFLDLIEEMETVALGDTFKSAVREYYEKDAQDGPCTEVENEFHQGCTHLMPLMGIDHWRTFISQLTELYEANRDYAAHYAFKCGLVSAFSQLYTDEHDQDGGFARTVMQDLLTQPGMERHKDFKSRLSIAHTLEETAFPDLYQDTAENMTCIDCALSNRVYNAALFGFYSGYRAGFKLIGELDPQRAALNLYKLQEVKIYLQFENI